MLLYQSCKTQEKRTTSQINEKVEKTSWHTANDVIKYQSCEK